MPMQNLGGKKKEYYGIFRSGLLLRPGGGGGGDSYMEQTGMLVGNFEFNP